MNPIHRNACFKILLAYLAVVIGPGCDATAQRSQTLNTSTDSKGLFDWLSPNDSTKDGVASFDPSRKPAEQTQAGISDGMRKMLRDFHTELDRYDVSETQRRDALRKVFPGQPDPVLDSLMKVR